MIMDMTRSPCDRGAMLLSLRLLAISTAIAFTQPAFACDMRVGKPIADRVTYEIDILIKFTKAVCTTAKEGPKCSLICFSDLYIEGINRNIVLLFIATSGGKKMREAGIAKFENIAFADRELLLRNSALKISASKAAQLVVDPSAKPQDEAIRIGSYFSEFGYQRR